jgi:hypothetical protein
MWTMRLLVLILVSAALVSGSVFGWRSCQHARQAFTPEEQALVDDLVTLYSIRITRSGDPDLARAMLDSLHLGVPTGDLDRRIDRLALDPPRATRLLQAVYDSLEAREAVFIREETQGIDPAPQPGRQAADGG